MDSDEDSDEFEKVPDTFGDYIPSLALLCLEVVSKNLTLDKCLDTLLMADQWHQEELKINCLKFISLNVVSFLEPFLFEKIIQLPVYLIRDIQNFIKASQVEKYASFDMQVIDQNYNIYGEDNEDELV